MVLLSTHNKKFVLEIKIFFTRQHSNLGAKRLVINLTHKTPPVTFLNAKQDSIFHVNQTKSFAKRHIICNISNPFLQEIQKISQNLLSVIMVIGIIWVSEQKTCYNCRQTIKTKIILHFCTLIQGRYFKYGARESNYDCM